MVAHQKSGSLIKVIAANEYSFLGWQAEVTPIPQSTDMAYTLPANKANISFHQITQLEDWLYIPTEPMLLSEAAGPLGWIRSGQPLPLQAQMCLEGCTLLTNKQMLALVKHLGGGTTQASKQKAIARGLDFHVFA